MPIDRRPLASRNTRWANALAGWLIRRGASPNGVSTAGLVAGLFAGVALAGTAFVDDPWRRVLWLTAAVCVQLRLLANLLDGMVAVGGNRTSKLGVLFNELPDRFSDAAALIGLGYAAGGNPELGYLAALAAVLTAYVRELGKTAGAGYTFAGPMAKPQRMALVTGTCVLNAVLPAGWDSGYHVATAALAVVMAGALLTVVRRLAIIAASLRAAP